MRIKTINIFGFGKWHDQTIDLQTDYQVLYGQNEAGKSTITAFIKGVLFGFATGKQKYEQYLPKSGAQYGGELIVDHHDREITIRRVAGKAGGEVTIIDQGKEFGADYLNQLIAPADKALFTQIFETNQQDLNQIFGLTADDFMQHLLTIGAVGSHEWLAFEASLDKASQQIYKPSGRKWPLNKALKQYPEIEQAVSQAKAANQQYESNDQQLQQALQTLKQDQAALAEVQGQKNQQQQLLERWPKYVEWQALQASLATTKPFDSTLYAQYQKIEEQRQESQAALADAQQAVATIQETLDQTGEFRFYQTHQAEIDGLLEQWSTRQKQAQQLALQQTQLTQLTSEQAALAAKYQWPTTETLPTVLSADQLEQLQVANTTYEQTQTTNRVLTDQLTTLTDQVAEQEQLVTILETPAEVASPTPMSNICLGLGVVGLLGIFLPGGLKAIALLGLGLLGYGLYTKYQGQQKQTADTTQKAQWQQALAKLDQLQADLQEKQTALADGQQALSTSQQQVATLLSTNGYSNEATVTQVMNQQDALARMQHLQALIAQQSAEINASQADLTDYFEQFAFAHDWLGALQGEPLHNLAQIEQFKGRLDQLKQALAQDNERYEYQQQQVTRLQRQDQERQVQQADLLEKAQLKTAAELAQCAAAEQQRQVQQQRQTDLEHELTSYLPQLQAFEDQAALETAIAQLTQQTATLTAAIQTQQQTIAELQVVQQKLVDSDAYQRQKQAQLNAEADIIGLAQDWLAKQLAIDWIQATLTAASQERFPRLLAKATQYFAILTQNRYIEITFEAATLTVLRQDQVLFEVGELSQGTAEQLYIALRFAFAEEIADVVSLPLLVDDGFVNFDDQRQAAVWQLLQNLSGAHQVIYLTANPRTEAAFGTEHWLNLEKVGLANDD